jgi:SAM-dependent methyltransferase
MAHPQQLSFIELFSKSIETGFDQVRILEIGSYVVEGGIRDFFPSSKYLGADLTAGPGVDLVVSGHLIDHPGESYDITISCECFEHNPYWLETFLNMYRLTVPGGFVIFSCATRGRLEHGTRRTSPSSSPGTQSVGWDYYRNLEPLDFTRAIDFGRLFESHLFLCEKDSSTLFFIGKKTGNSKLYQFDRDGFAAAFFEKQNALRQLLWDSKSIKEKIGSIILSVVLAPTALIVKLPDNYYQNISLIYIRFMRLIFGVPVRMIGKIFGLHLRR